MFTKSIKEINQLDYNRLLTSSYSDLYSYILEKANDSAYPACGYGFYSPRMYRKDNRCYISWEHYDSCD